MLPFKVLSIVSYECFLTFDMKTDLVAHAVLNLAGIEAVNPF